MVIYPFRFLALLIASDRYFGENLDWDNSSIIALSVPLYLTTSKLKEFESEETPLAVILVCVSILRLFRFEKRSINCRPTSDTSVPLRPIPWTAGARLSTISNNRSVSTVSHKRIDSCVPFSICSSCFSTSIGRLSFSNDGFLSGVPGRVVVA
jgi:hypothetical protein